MSQYATRDMFFTGERRYKESQLWNGSKVLIRSLRESEFSRIDVENVDATRGGLSREGMRLSNCRVLIAAICDANPSSPTYKQPLFKETDLKALFNADTIMIQPLVREVREHCGLRQDMEELLKNFAAIGVEDSPSSSSEQPEQEPSTDST